MAMAIDAALSVPHSHHPGGVRWAVTPAGISINGGPPDRTPGPPVTAKRVYTWFGSMIVLAGHEFDVAPTLLAAIICNESAGGGTAYADCCTARREEPGWTSDIQTPHRVSVGCCQTLISTAREALKAPRLSAVDLQSPKNSIRAAAAYIGAGRDQHHSDPPLVAACYNAGGLYLEDVLTNRWKLRCFPLGTGEYIDRFVLWFNDCVYAAGKRAAAYPDA
jgi:Transglycosylase SLT domain